MNDSDLDRVPLNAVIEALRNLTEWNERMSLATRAVADNDLSDIAPQLSTLAASDAQEDRRVAGDLLVALAEGTDQQRLWTRDRVWQLFDPNGEPVLLERVLEAASAFHSVEAVNALVSAARHPDARVRRRVAVELGIQDEELLTDAVDAALLALAEDDDASVREWALFALGHQRETPLATQAAIRAYDLNRAHRDCDVRCEALEALWRLGDRDALAQALKDCDPSDDLLDAARAAADSRLLPSLRALQQTGAGDKQRLSDAIAACTRP